MKKGLAFAFVVSAWCLPVQAQAAGALQLLSDDRFVNAFGEACIENGGGLICDPFESETQNPSPDFSNFSDSVSAGDGGFASQTSVAGATSLSGIGFASGFSDVGYGIGNSVYDVSFRLLGPAQIDLDGTLESFDTFGFGFAESEVRLSTGGQILFEAIADPINNTVPFSFSQVLPPGDYRLLLQADGDVSMDGSFDFTLTAAAESIPGLRVHGLLSFAAALAIGGRVALQRVERESASTLRETG